MNFIQRLVKRIFPKHIATAMEEESKQWIMQCTCGYEQSVWDAGGIRYKAAGNPKWLRTCTACGQKAWHNVYWDGDR